MKKLLLLTILVLSFSSCSKSPTVVVGNDYDPKKWSCVNDTDLKVMYAQDKDGDIRSASRGCTCAEIEDFQKDNFGTVDYEALKRDFGCDIEK